MNFSPHPWGISWGIYPISAPPGEDAVAKILTLVTKLSRKDCCLKLELNFNRGQGENGHQGGCPFAEVLGDPVNPLNLFFPFLSSGIHHAGTQRTELWPLGPSA